MTDILIGLLSALGPLAIYVVGAMYTGRAVYQAAERGKWGDSWYIFDPHPAFFGVIGALAWPLAGPIAALVLFMSAPSRKREIALRAQRAELDARIRTWVDLAQAMPQGSTERNEAYAHIRETRIERDRL